MILATFWSLWLPSVNRTIYFHQQDHQHHSFPKKAALAFRLMNNHFVRSYSNKYVVKWSVWWALSTCCFIQVQSYMQPLWSQIIGDNTSDDKQKLYNGLVEAGLTILGFLGAILAGVMRVDWVTKGDLFITIFSLLQGFILLIASQTSKLYVSYICYMIFGALYHISITVASTEIAKQIELDSHGLIFGINTFVAAGVQSILTTVVVTSAHGFGLAPRQQYVVYGICHIVIAALYIVIGLVVWAKRSREHRRESLITNSSV